MPLEEKEELDLPFHKPDEAIASQPDSTINATQVTSTSTRDVSKHVRSNRSMANIPGVKRPLTHTNSLAQLPKFGIETSHEEQLGKFLENIDLWGLDIFKVHEYSNGHPLVAIMYTIFRVSSAIFVCLIRSVSSARRLSHESFYCVKFLIHE